MGSRATFAEVSIEVTAGKLADCNILANPLFFSYL
jgi:hypothetical protein